ncbi:MAG: hypothetical protein ACI4AA_00805 [Lachnospiraceae bacterium]
MMKCKECGADFDEHLAECPFCGALNYTGAEEAYLNHLEKIRDDLSEMADDSEEAYKKTMKKSTLIIIIVLCCLILAAGLITGLFFLFRSSLFPTDNGDLQKAQMLWRNQYMDTLDEMYVEGDYDGILNFLNEHSGDEGFSPYGWAHLDFMEVYDTYTQFKAETQDPDKNDLEKMTWCLYDAASIDYATTQDFFEYTEEELELITSWQEETKTFYHEVLGLTDAEITEMKSEIASDDQLAIPTSKNCRKYLKQHFDF